MTDMIDIIDNMDERERLLFLSAREVKNSAFWAFLLESLDGEAQYCNQAMMTKLMEGDEKAALINAAKLQAIDWVLKTIEDITQDVEDEALNQEQGVKHGH